MSNLAYALEAAMAGLYVYPGGVDKRPHRMLWGEAPKGQGGFNLATRDPGLIRQWWSQDPSAIVMYNPSMSGLFVADDDTVKKGTSRPELPDTPHVTNTKNGGKHNVYREAEGGLVPRGISDAIDIVHHGGVVLPTPGSGYSWEDQPVSLAELLDAPRWPVDHPWPRGWRGRGRGKGRDGRRSSGGDLREAPNVVIPYPELWARYAGQKPGWKHDAITDRSKAAWSLLQECRGAGCPDDLAGEILAGYPPLRERCAERADPDGALEDWIAGQLAILDQEGCAHVGRNCVAADCPRASDWLMSVVLTPGMLEARAMVEAEPGLSEREVLRRVFGSKRPAWLFDWIRANAERRRYWAVVKARKGTRGPARATLLPHGRSGRLEHSPVALSRVDRETGEILAEGCPAPSFEGPAPSFDTQRESDEGEVFYIGHPESPLLLGCEQKLGAEENGQVKEKESETDRSSNVRFELGDCVSCGRYRAVRMTERTCQPCVPVASASDRPLPTPEVAAA